MFDETKPTISLENAQIYQNNHLVLKDVSFEISKGEFVYLIGRTGSGKSSLLKTLYGDLNLKQGNAQIAGYKLEKLKESEIPFLRRRMGIIFQDFQLLEDRNVFQNLKFVLEATDWKNSKNITNRIDEVLAQVNMSTKKHKKPHQLSGGEQQRVSIARALLNNPELILADEPTGNLDPQTSIEIIELLKDITSKKTVLMASHDQYLMEKFPNRTIVCDKNIVFER
tara:strand:+ start:782 stop:1456 length:675 start_codon:yes stop_codon:yes gene_type:complete